MEALWAAIAVGYVVLIGMIVLGSGWRMFHPRH